MTELKIEVNTEIGNLKCVLIHSPDSGLGKVVPSKAQDWLFEDIVHLDTIRRKEYDFYVKTLLYFLDPDKIKGRLHAIDALEDNRTFFKPDHPAFHASNKVIELETLLADILKEKKVRELLVAAVCAAENCTYQLQNELNNIKPAELAKILISGAMTDMRMIFAPLPNLIFTRDIAITINGFILLNKPAKKARSRETLLARYILFHHPYFKHNREKILEIEDASHFFLKPDNENKEKTTLECGDLMMVSKNHLLIGCSERTSVSGANEVIKLLFAKGAVEKITVIKIPNKRDFMHLDTVFTQVKRNVWVLLGSLFSPPSLLDHPEPIDHIQLKDWHDQPEIIQFEKGNINHPKKIKYLEELLSDISENDLKSTAKTVFIYSGNNTFPYDAREQWTDSCNLLVLREGVVIAYDRNDKTLDTFKKHGFSAIHVADLLEKFERDELYPDQMKDTLILMPSAELSRARGGFHCMSLPLFREEV
ncbi:MAG: arginine deiminase family protein [Sphingobacteriaceae bacterium]